MDVKIFRKFYIYKSNWESLFEALQEKHFKIVIENFHSNWGRLNKNWLIQMKVLIERKITRNQVLIEEKKEFFSNMYRGFPED